jgi:NitT/TauT family transport system substrate-binding protein
LKRHARRVAALALVPALVVGCSAMGGNSTESGPGAGGIEKSAVTVATVATVDLAPFWIALDNGYFKAEGLDVREVPAAKTEVSLTKVQSGEVDVGLSTYPAIFLVLARDVANVRLVADGTWASAKSNQIVTVPSSGIKDVHDLAGKRIAVSSITQASGVLTKSVMADHGVDFSKVQWQQLPFPNMAAALKAGEVDAAYLPEPFQTQAAASVGAVPVIDAATGSAEGFPLTGYAALSTWVQENPKTMAAFQRAMFKATRFAVDHRDDVERAVVKHAKVDEGTAKMMTLPAFGSKLDARRIQRVPDLLKPLGVIDRQIDAASVIVPQYAG